MTGPRYSIIPADAYADERMKDLHIRVLGILGTHTDNNGWCEVNQRVVAEKCGRTRETINRVIRDLCEFGFLSKQEQKTKANGRTINLYQVLMDRPVKLLDVAPPVTVASQGAVISEDHNPCDVATSQLNVPSFNEKKDARTRTGPTEGLALVGGKVRLHSDDPLFREIVRMRQNHHPPTDRGGYWRFDPADVDQARENLRPKAAKQPGSIEITPTWSTPSQTPMEQEGR